MSEVTPNRSVRSRRGLAALAVVVAVAGAAVVIVLSASEEPRATAGTAGSSELPPATASITRGDLSDSVQQDGTLGHLGERKIRAGGPAGTLTWLAPSGSVVERDERLYEVDGQPVRLMYGAEPMYRTLKPGDKGRDVQQLEENLVSLGYTGFDVDEDYTALTAAAVKRWQKSHGLTQTGSVGPDRIAFVGGAVRVKEAVSALGDRIAPGAAALTVTGSERVVHFRLPVPDAKSVKVGTRVKVRLPDGTEAPGKVSAVGKVASAGGDPQDKTPKIDVTVSFDNPRKVSGIDQSPVTVELTGETRRNVLSVPVNALLALPGGGFGVQVVENGRARDVQGEIGMFGQGRVEISGTGLREGMKVGVPSA